MNTSSYVASYGGPVLVPVQHVPSRLHCHSSIKTPKFGYMHCRITVTVEDAELSKIFELRVNLWHGGGGGGGGGGGL